MASRGDRHRGRQPTWHDVPVTTPQEPRDEDQPTMPPAGYGQPGPDGSTQPMPQQYGSPYDPYAQQAQPYGSPQNPYGPASPSPYAQQPGYGQAYPPGYGYGQPAQNHPSAQTAMVLGLIGLGGLFVCGVTLFLSPFAWRMGARARREIDASNGTLGGRDTATVGYVTGIIGTVLLVLALLVAVAAVLLLVGVAGTTYSTT